MLNREETIRLLHAIDGFPAAFPYAAFISSEWKRVLIDIASDPSVPKAVRENALFLLAQKPDSEVVALLHRLAWRDGNMDLPAIQLLGEINSPEADEALLFLARAAPLDSIRAAAISTLVSRGRHYSDVLRIIDTETSQRVISCFLSSSSVSPRPEGVSVAMRFLNHPDNEVRENALSWLSRACECNILTPQQQQQLIEELKNRARQEREPQIRQKIYALLWKFQ